jgi:hypothetical protein
VARSDSELERMLADLQMAEFIYEQPSLGDVEFTFKHALTHACCMHRRHHLIRTSSCAQSCCVLPERRCLNHLLSEVFELQSGSGHISAM